MSKFKIRAQWWGPDGAQVGVADDTTEADDACFALDNAQRRQVFGDKIAAAAGGLVGLAVSVWFLIYEPMAENYRRGGCVWLVCEQEPPPVSAQRAAESKGKD